MGKVLFHFTSTYHLPLIFESKHLKLTESNLRYHEPMYKPVVWFTSSEDATCNGLGEGEPVIDTYKGKPLRMLDKTEVKITVKWQKHFQYWKSWSLKNKMNPVWSAALQEGMNSGSWWISEKIISFEDVLKIENTKTGEVYFVNECLKTVI